MTIVAECAVKCGWQLFRNGVYYGEYDNGEVQSSAPLSIQEKSTLEIRLMQLAMTQKVDQEKKKSLFF